MKEKTYHSYFTECSKALYEEYGQIIEKLAICHIQNMGVHFQEAIRGDNGNLYHYGILVMAAHPLTTEELKEFFPKLTSRWSHKEEELAQSDSAPPPFTLSEQQDGKLLLKVTKGKVSFRL